MNDQQDVKQKQQAEPDEKEEKKTSDCSEIEEKVKNLENQLKYAVADFRNREKRIEEERREFVKFANKELLTRLLPAFDTLLLAEKYIKDEGLKISVKKLLDVLKEVGVERIVTEGKKFDPEKMEVVEVVEGDENKVLEETRPGFSLHGKTLLAALVKVGGKK